MVGDPMATLNGLQDRGGRVLGTALMSVPRVSLGLTLNVIDLLGELVGDFDVWLTAQLGCAYRLGLLLHKLGPIEPDVTLLRLGRLRVALWMDRVVVLKPELAEVAGLYLDLVVGSEIG